MFVEFKNLRIRNATPEDAEQLATWWNNGKIMGHAGFPNGLGTTAEQIATQIKGDNDLHRRLILDLDGIPVGEMSYYDQDGTTAEIGIKICEFSLHNQGLGKKFLSMLISSLFHEYGYERVILDTNLKNKRAQHVYERLGFHRIGVRENAWRDQLGEWNTVFDYELCKEDFVNFTKT